MSSGTQTTKDTSFSISLSRKTKKRDRPFHDRYLYSVDFFVAGAALLRGMQSASYLRSEIPIKFDKRKNMLLSYMPQFKPPATGFESHLNDRIERYKDKRVLEGLYAAYDLLSSLKDIRLTLRDQWVTIHCNHLNMLEAIEKFLIDFQDTAKHTTTSANQIIITEAIIDRPKGTIRRKNPKWSHRIMMRHISVTESQFAGIAQFCETYKDVVRASDSLLRWVEKGHRQWNSLESHFFIDVNDPKLINLLEICAPGITDKLFEIIADK